VTAPDLVKDEAFERLHPRGEHGRFGHRLGHLLHKAAEDWGAVVDHQEFGDPDHPDLNHGIVSLHQDGQVSLYFSGDDEHGQPSAVMLTGGLDGQDIDELTNDIGTALDELEKGADGDNELDEASPGEISLTFGTHRDGTQYVGLDTGDDGVSMSPVEAQELAESLETIRNRQMSFNPDDPSTTMPLAEGEHLERRKVLGDDGTEFGAVAGLVTTPHGPRVRLGVIALGDEGAKHWSGGQGLTTVDLDKHSASEIADVLDEFQAAGKTRQKLYDKHVAAFEAREEAGEEVDWNDLDDALADDGLAGSFEDDYGSRNVETPWGTVRLTDVGMNDEANAHDWHVRLETWPKSMTEAEYDAGNPDHADWAWPGSQWQKPSADLELKDVKALVKLLRGTFAEGVSA
jgi:hypothetical protein